MSGNTSQPNPLVSVLEVRSGKRVEAHIIGPGKLVAHAVAVSYTHLTLPTIYSV